MFVLLQQIKSLNIPKNMDFDSEFLMELFLDDSVTTLNRLVVASANVITENNENISILNDILKKECTSQEANSVNIPTRRGQDQFYENTVLHYGDKDYKDRFKMKKSTVQAIINLLQESMKPGSTIVPLDKKVHIFLWLLTTDSSYNEIGVLFGLQKSSVSYIFHQIASALAEQRYNFINWPSIEEQHVTRLKVNSRYGFPNCVGFIDACCLKIGSKRTKKSKPETVLLQAVCNESLMFIDIHVGAEGNTRKNRVFRESTLSTELKNFIDFDNHILGDSEYKLKKNLITPYTNEELLTSEEMKFNDVHWKAHTHIGLAFELLRGRFKKLNHIDTTKLEVVNTLIYAACVLHNFILLHEGCILLKEEATLCEDGVTIDTDIVKTAIEKRQFLCNYINYIDAT